LNTNISNNQNKYILNLINNRDDWNLLLKKLDIFSTYMKWLWGVYKENNGWNVKRFRIVDIESDKAIACFKLQTKHKWFAYIHLLQGGIHVIRGTRIKNIYDSAIKLIHKYIQNNSNFLWILFVNYQSHHIDEADTAMMKNKFSPILTNKMFAFLLSSDKINEDYSSLSKNWKHNLIRAKKSERLKIDWDTTYEDRIKTLKQLSEMYNKLLIRKNFPAAIDLNYISEMIALDKKIL